MPSILFSGVWPLGTFTENDSGERNPFATPIGQLTGFEF